MTDILKSLARQFGINVGQDDAPVTPTLPVDPNAVAELDGSLIMDRRREELARNPGQPSRASPGSGAPAFSTARSSAVGSSGGPVDESGNVDFDAVFRLSALPKFDFTAEQALDAITNVEASIPPVISDQAQRDGMIRAMLMAVNRGPAAVEKLVLDAHNKQNALDDFVQRRGFELVNMKTEGAETIRKMEARIAQAKQAITAAEKQFDTLSASCKARRGDYDRVIDLFSAPPDVSGPAAASPTKPKPPVDR